MLRLFLFCFTVFIVDYYSYQVVKAYSNSNWVKYTYIAFNLLILVLTLYIYSIGRNSISIPVSNLITGAFILVYISKLVIGIIGFSEDIYRILNAIYTYLFNKDQSSFHLPSRRRFVKHLSIGLASIPFSSLLYGIIKGKYNFKVIKHTLYFKDLPKAFDGYNITHISDIHSGSFDDKAKIEYAIDLINEQKSDLLLFTGDMVNLKASEMEPWKAVFSKLSARDGLFSVLGNHDYGDYIQWKDEKAKADNLNQLQSIQKEIGFDLLLNESRFITRGQDRLALIGVENWGKGFRKNGDLEQASKHVSKEDFKLVMSHDPTHWQEEIIPHNTHYHLTLSGHTHGMQMGIEIPGWIKWSPIKWRYKYWAGIYKEQNRVINVNRGFGFLAYPGRLGIWPEITVIELKKGNKPN